MCLGLEGTLDIKVVSPKSNRGKKTHMNDI